jgi:hypothetical protein
MVTPPGQKATPAVPHAAPCRAAIVQPVCRWVQMSLASMEFSLLLLISFEIIVFFSPFFFFFLFLFLRFFLFDLFLFFNFLSENQFSIEIDSFSVFGWKYYPLGALKLISDGLGFAGPLLLNELVCIIVFLI